MQKIPVIAITPGEPAGIGPDVLIQSIHDTCFDATLVAIADPLLLESRAHQLGLPLKLHPLTSDTLTPLPPSELWIHPVKMKVETICGKLNKANAAYVLDTLNCAVTGCMQRHYQAMVTAPVHKGIINDAGYHFSGHTEFLADLTGTSRVVMMLATEKLRVALATTHLPLRRVADSITNQLLEEVITILNLELTAKFGIENPRILVCGLNPHAGEGGHLGREELDIIEPALTKLRDRGLTLIGPLPADSLFTEKTLQQGDAVLAMYHDQGLPVLKYAGFGCASNITLGLPIIRTSVDHGTALDLAGTGEADSGSLVTAINQAIAMAHTHHHSSGKST